MTWQPTPLVFPDVELLLCTHLRAGLAALADPLAVGVAVSNAAPNPLPPRLVTVRRDGGTATATRDRPRIGVNVWAESERVATDLASLVRALLQGLPDGAPVLAVPTVGGPSAVPDPSGKPRRFFTAEIHVRGVPL